MQPRRAARKTQRAAATRGIDRHAELRYKRLETLMHTDANTG